MRYQYFMVLLLLSSLTIVAQEAPNMNSSISGSVAAATSGKQINIPVNYFTGIPNISIPIHSYTRSGIGMSVTLDYFAGGIKVDEPASNIGLGWQLNAGGIIIRNQRGLPDDFPGRGFLYTPQVDPGSKTGINPKRYSYENYGTDSIDSEQDVFQYNVAGRTGTFLIGKNGAVVTIPRQNIKVRWKTGTISGISASNITEFTIIFEDGSRYLFSNREITTRRLSNYDYSASYVSAWHLTSIISTYAEDTIQFKYKTVLTGKTVPQVASRFERAGEPPINYTGSQYVRVEQKYLEQIMFPYNVTLNFLYDTAERADSKREYALKNIELRDTVLRMGYKLEYQYFSSTGTLYPYGSTDTTISKLKLQRLSIYTQFRTLYPYEFSYASGKVPKINNTSQDHWGYFNNKVNIDLIPAIGSYSGANREPDSVYARSGILTAIKYPSGAKTTFSYEGNECKNYFYQQNQAAIIGAYPDYIQSKVFSISRYTTTLAQLNLFVGRHVHCPVTISLKNAANQVIDQFQTDGTAVGTSKTYNLAGGSYTLSMAPISSCGSTNVPECSLSWLNEVQDTTYRLMGGLRVKEIVTEDSLNGAPPMIRRFKYINENGSSSGFAFFVPKYDYLYNVFYRNGGDKEYFVRVSAPLNSLDYVWGTPVGYSRVEEILPGNGKTVHEFSTYKDLNYYPSPPQFPFAAELYPSWELGLPKKVTVFDQYNLVKKINENSYDYNVTVLSDTAFKSIKLISNAQYYGSPSTLYLGPGYGSDTYYGITGMALLDSTVEKLVSGTDTVLQSSSFTYDSLNNLASVKKWISKDLQKYIQTNIYYPYNYSLTGPVKTLSDSGIIVKVSEEQWMKTPTSENLISATITGYEVITGNKIKPKYIYGLQSDKPVPLSTIGAFNRFVLNRNSTLIPLVNTIERYDAKLVSLQVANNLTGGRQSVIWDDEHQISTSTVSDAAYTEIAYTSFEGTNNGNWNLPSGQYNYSDAITGSRSFKLNGTISATVTAGREYVVTYWTTGAGIVINGSVPEKLATKRSWNLYRNSLPSATSSISITGSNVTIDELRAYPADATMSSSVVDFFGNQTSSSTENNKVAYTEYDDLARVRLREDAQGNIMEMNCYGQAGEKVNCNIIYKNNAISRKFVQTNCSNGVPDTISYTVSPGTYTSLISQYKADSLAMNAVIANGQAYANASGGCGLVYAKLSYEDLDVDQDDDVVVKFYSDAACTKPRYVQNLQVVVGINNTCDVIPDIIYTVTGTEIIMVSTVVRDYVKTECDPPGFPCWDFNCHADYFLKAGNYVIK